MKKLEKLTDEQIKIMHETREEWIKFCLGGDNSINRDMAAQGIRWIYGLAKLDSPFVIFVDGPMQCQMAVWILKSWFKDRKFFSQTVDQVGDQVRDQVWNQVWAQVRSQAVDQVSDQVGDQVRDQVWNQVRAQVGDQVWNQVGDQVNGQVSAQVGAQVKVQVWDQVKVQVWGQVGGQVKVQVWDQVRDQEYNDFSWRDLNDSDFVSFYNFFEKIGINVTSNFKKYRDYIRSGVFMTIFLNGFAIACPRPFAVRRDELNRLHSDRLPACEWIGEKYWFWHGVPVTQQIIEFPESITIEQIENEKNLEVQRIMIERFGIDKYIEKQNADILDEDNLGLQGSCDRKLIKIKNNTKWLVCSDGTTGRIYHISVPNEVMNCKEAHSEICGFDESRIIAEA